MFKYYVLCASLHCIRSYCSKQCSKAQPSGLFWYSSFVFIWFVWFMEKQQYQDPSADLDMEQLVNLCTWVGAGGLDRYAKQNKAKQ